VRWILFFSVLTTAAGLTISVSGHSDPEVLQVDESPVTSGDGWIAYLPLIVQSDRFSSIGIPIWLNGMATSAHEVGLFRGNFSIQQEVESLELCVFADTRYEVYLDGVWLGRGPARFSSTLHEYDVYPIHNLQEGEHLIAMLVQWAPNNRRSESQSQFLQANLRDDFGSIYATGQTWKGLRSGAWNNDSVPVHSWGLIGPTEILDLRKLPQTWMQPGFDDSTWPYAVPADKHVSFSQRIVPKVDSGGFEMLVGSTSSEDVTNDPPIARYQPRSISPLASYPITATLVEMGELSPGRRIVELPGSNPTYQIDFTAVNVAPLLIEVLVGEHLSPTERIRFDGVPLNFHPIGDNRPDVLAATQTITAGQHTLTVDRIPAEGSTLGISSENLVFQDPLPFVQGVHAGRRLLLAEPSIAQKNPQIITGTTISFSLSSPGYAVIDLGRTVHGRADLEIEGEEGTIVDLGWDERLFAATTRPLPYPGTLHPQWDQVDSWILDGTNRSLSTIDTRSGRYLLVAVWGDVPVDIRLSVTEERYPVTQIGNFDSSNDLLDQIWQVGIDSSYLNMTDAFADPWRERGQWWGDAYVVDQVNRVGFGDFSLMRRGLRLMADAFEDGRPEGLAPNGTGLHMVDYGMLWVLAYQEYVQLTGDLEFGRSLYPTLVAFLAYLEALENPSTGLLDLPEDGWARTIYIDSWAWQTRKGQSAAANAFYAETYARAALIAKAIGDSKMRYSWGLHSKQIKQQTNDLLYLPDQERYLTSIYQGEPISPTLYSQAWPLAYNLVEPENAPGVKDAFDELLIPEPANVNIGVYGMYWVLKGFGDYGFIPEALSVIETYYGWMLSNGATTWWETFQAKEDYAAALSHGWGSAPTWFLTTYVLGARQTGPENWQIRPPFSGVDTVSGEIPMPQGSLFVHWVNKACQGKEIRLRAPSGTQGEVILEQHPEQKISLNSEIVWDGQSQSAFVKDSNQEISIMLEDGAYEIFIEHSCASQLVQYE